MIPIYTHPLVDKHIQNPRAFEYPSRSSSPDKESQHIFKTFEEVRSAKPKTTPQKAEAAKIILPHQGKKNTAMSEESGSENEEEWLERQQRKDLQAAKRQLAIEKVKAARAGLVAQRTIPLTRTSPPKRVPATLAPPTNKMAPKKKVSFPPTSAAPLKKVPGPIKTSPTQQVHPNVKVEQPACDGCARPMWAHDLCFCLECASTPGRIRVVSPASAPEPLGHFGSGPEEVSSVGVGGVGSFGPEEPVDPPIRKKKAKKGSSWCWFLVKTALLCLILLLGLGFASQMKTNDYVWFFGKVIPSLGNRMARWALEMLYWYVKLFAEYEDIAKQYHQAFFHNVSPTPAPEEGEGPFEL